MENPEEKEANKRNRENSQNAAEDFSAVGVGLAEGAQGAAGHEKQPQSHEEESCPREITRDGVAGKKRGVADEGGQGRAKPAHVRGFQLRFMYDSGSSILADACQEIFVSFGVQGAKSDERGVARWERVPLFAES